MTQDSNLSLNASDSFLLKEEIKALEFQIKNIIDKLDGFEAVLRSELINEIVEEQELSVLYKKLKQEKKVNRLNQKRRGKNYIEPQGLIQVVKKETPVNNDDQKEKKRLYREALLQVHPDKFSLNSKNIDTATEVSSKLISIYQSGDLLELQEYHAHIFSGNALDLESLPKNQTPDTSYLKNQIEQLRHQLQDIKNKHTYKVLTEYPDPLTFVDELKAYYSDRLLKLRKRTRKG